MAQRGYLFKKNGSWFLRYRDDFLVGGMVVRKQVCKRLAPVSDRYRTERDLRELVDEILRPINSGKARPATTMSVSEVAEENWLPWVRENCKPSTVAGYEVLWRTYLKPFLPKISLRDFRTVDACNLLAEIHRQKRLGRSTLSHCKSRISGVFTLARNQGALDGLNPICGSMLPKKASAPTPTHATTFAEVKAILDALEKAGETTARAAVALTFFAALRPGEARGLRWEDFDGQRLCISRSIWHTHTTTPKTVNSASSVPVIETLRVILEEVRAADQNPSQGPILRGPSRVAANLDNLSKRVMTPVLKTAGITWRGFYSVRRGVATILTGLSKDNGLASKGLLRHTNLATTTRHYLKDIPETTLNAMQLLEELFNGCAPTYTAHLN